MLIGYSSELVLELYSDTKSNPLHTPTPPRPMVQSIWATGWLITKYLTIMESEIHELTWEQPACGCWIRASYQRGPARFIPPVCFSDSNISVPCCMVLLWLFFCFCFFFFKKDHFFWIYKASIILTLKSILLHYCYFCSLALFSASSVVI